MPPLVSCICLTFNRPPGHLHLVEEAVESFLRQDYPNKELVILNDTPEQSLVCDAEGVRVVNVPERYPTLGDKWNAAVGFSQGSVIAPWDDDDISLPWRLSYSIARLGDADYFNPRAYWFLSPDYGLRSDRNNGFAHNASIYTRSAFDTVGGHQAISLGLDRELHKALLSTMENVVDPRSRHSEPVALADWFYIYRWRVSPGHVSSKSEGDGSRRYREIGERPIVDGCYHLEPHWKMNYVMATRWRIDNPDATEMPRF